MSDVTIVSGATDTREAWLNAGPFDISTRGPMRGPDLLQGLAYQGCLCGSRHGRKSIEDPYGHAVYWRVVGSPPRS